MSAPAGDRKGTARGRRRSAARLAAVQILYEMEMAGAPADTALREFLADRWTRDGADTGRIEPDGEWLTALVRGVAERRGDVDGMIGESLSADWTLQRLEEVLKAVLRAGAYELLACGDVPPRVVITEYVDVAHAFFAGNEPALVNAVLDRLAHVLRPGQLEEGNDDGEERKDG